jgi:hypothetical protein
VPNYFTQAWYRFSLWVAGLIQWLLCFVASGIMAIAGVGNQTMKKSPRRLYWKLRALLHIDGLHYSTRRVFRIVDQMHRDDLELSKVRLEWPDETYDDEGDRKRMILIKENSYLEQLNVPWMKICGIAVLAIVIIALFFAIAMAIYSPGSSSLLQ